MISTLISALIVTCLGPGVVDGDTLNVCGERVRLWGLDAPEHHHPAGPASTRALADLTRGQQVTCTQAQSSRSWGRLVADCTLPDGRSLTCENLLIVRISLDASRITRIIYLSTGRRPT